MREVKPFTEGKMSKGGQNPPCPSTSRPPAPGGSGTVGPDLKNLMDHGFTIYESDNKWVLNKISTAKDIRKGINDDPLGDASKLEFDSYDAAVAKAVELISLTKFQITVRYNKGFGPRHKTLDETIMAASLKEANEVATSLASKYFDKETEIVEVKVMPSDLFS